MNETLSDFRLRGANYTEDGKVVVWRVQNAISGDYIATTLDDALAFIEHECAGDPDVLEHADEVCTLYFEHREPADVIALPEWSA